MFDCRLPLLPQKVRAQTLFWQCRWNCNDQTEEETTTRSRRHSASVREEIVAEVLRRNFVDMDPSSSFYGRSSRPSLSSLVTDARRSMRSNFDRQPSGSNQRSWSAYLKASLAMSRVGIPSPKTGAFILSCLLWYFSSALSSNTSKALLSSNKHIQPRPPPLFPYPVTLTLAQFFFVHIFSSAISSPNVMRWIPGVRRPVTRIVKDPGRERLLDMAKLSAFNVVGHALSSIALSRVPVSTVHTIKVSACFCSPSLSFHSLTGCLCGIPYLSQYRPSRLSLLCYPFGSCLA